MSTFEAWERTHPMDVLTHNILFLALGVVFFFAPCILFVFGLQYVPSRLADLLTRGYWMHMGHVGFRVACWLLGAAVFGIPYSYFLRWIHAI